MEKKTLNFYGSHLVIFSGNFMLLFEASIIRQVSDTLSGDEEPLNIIPAS